MPNICPLLAIAVKESGMISDIEERQARCITNECAWYVAHDDHNKAGCAIKVLSDSMISINPHKTHD